MYADKISPIDCLAFRSGIMKSHKCQTHINLTYMGGLAAHRSLQRRGLRCMCMRPNWRCCCGCCAARCRPLVPAPAAATGWLPSTSSINSPAARRAHCCACNQAHLVSCEEEFGCHLLLFSAHAFIYSSTSNAQLSAVEGLSLLPMHHFPAFYITVKGC